MLLSKIKKEKNKIQLIKIIYIILLLNFDSDKITWLNELIVGLWYLLSK